MDATIIDDNDWKAKVEVPKVMLGRHPELYEAGEWSFDIRDEYDPQLALDAIGAWIAWYKFLTEE